MISRLHAAHAEGKSVDATSISLQQVKACERSEQALAAAHQLLAGVHPVQHCKSDALAATGEPKHLWAGTGQARVDRVSEAAGGCTSAQVLDADAEDSHGMQQLDKARDAHESGSGPEGLPVEDAIGVALMADAAVHAPQNDAPSVTGWAEEESSTMYMGTAQRLSEGVLHTFVADRLVVDGAAEISEMHCRSTGSASMDMQPLANALGVEQNEESVVYNAAPGGAGVILLLAC
jgi:hypothetical protein